MAAADGDAPDAVDRLLAAIGLRMEEARTFLDDATSRWRGDALRVSEGTRHRLADLFRELGLVTRDDWDELELRVAQLEHRLRLLEDREPPPPRPAPHEDASWPSRVIEEPPEPLLP
jgi:polyhydroxyalkanoate synthesis regulator phasin